MDISKEIDGEGNGDIAYDYSTLSQQVNAEQDASKKKRLTKLEDVAFSTLHLEGHEDDDHHGEEERER